MINRSLVASSALAIALAFAAPSSSFAQMPATNAAAAAPTAPAATPLAAPAPAASDTTTASSTERPDTYTIVKGDTLWSISHKYDTSIKALMKLNNLKKHALLHIGQVIKIPPATPAASDSSAK